MLYMDTFADRLKESLKAKGITATELARRIGVSKATVSLWVKGTTKQLEGDNLLKTAHELNREPRWLQSGQGPKSRGDRVDSADTGPAKAPVLPWDVAHLHNTAQAHERAIEWLPNMTTHTRWFLLRTDNESHYGSRELPLGPQTLIVIDPDAELSAVSKLGRPTFAVVRVPSGDNLLRRVSNEGSRTYLHPLNPAYPPEAMPEGGKIVGIVVGVRMNFDWQ